MPPSPSGAKYLGIDFTQVDAVGAPKHALGLEVDCDDGTRRKYIRAGAAIAATDALKVDFAEGSFDFDPTSAVAQPLAGVATVALADNEFGWVIVRGPAIVKAAATVVAGAHAASTAVAGTLDDVTAAAADAQAAAAGIGAMFRTVTGSGVATVILS
jgi:hypothetical protein